MLPATPDKPLIRLLTPMNASAYRALRLRCLREHPQAFTSDADEAQAQPVSWSIQRLTPQPDKPHDFFLGAFVEGTLVGLVGLQGRYRAKERHAATVVGMYVVPERSRLGLGAALLTALLEHARALPELEQLDLSVTQGNDKPQALYERQGFRVFGVHPHAIKVNGVGHAKVLMHMRLAGGAQPDRAS
jgi:ribosomal protein S18 acetylase RimI-like enzyme